MKPRILTIIVTYNGMKWVDRCIGSVLMSHVPSDVMVVDNGSSDGTADYVARMYQEVKLISTGINYGFGKANNIGFEYALEQGYDYIYLLNQDAWIYPDTFSGLISKMEEDSSLGILSPMQMAACEDRPDPRFEKWCPRAAFRDMGSSWRKARIYDVKFVMAAHWMISRECLERVGGFSPAFLHYGEDDNFIHRAVYKGFRVGIYSGVKAIHDREMRPISKEASMRLKCVASVVKLSNPLNCLFYRKIRQPLELLAISVRYNSGYVFRYIFTFIRSYRNLKSLRLQSLEDGAFLELPE